MTVQQIAQTQPLTAESMIKIAAEHEVSVVLKKENRIFDRLVTEH